VKNRFVSAGLLSLAHRCRWDVLAAAAAASCVVVQRCAPLFLDMSLATPGIVGGRERSTTWREPLPKQRRGADPDLPPTTITDAPQPGPRGPALARTDKAIDNSAMHERWTAAFTRPILQQIRPRLGLPNARSSARAVVDIAAGVPGRTRPTRRLSREATPGRMPQVAWAMLHLPIAQSVAHGSGAETACASSAAYSVDRLPGAPAQRGTALRSREVDIQSSRALA